MNENGNKEMTYHFLEKNGINYSELQKLRSKNREYREMQVTALSEYHVRIEHPDDFVLCRFLDEMVAFEKSKRTKK